MPQSFNGTACNFSKSVAQLRIKNIFISREKLFTTPLHFLILVSVLDCLSVFPDDGRLSMGFMTISIIYFIKMKSRLASFSKNK